ncbi:MAG: hypothetical protein EA405_10225 [Rhodospirillales bacterium]|nr:MAG: hypothetical protein EA405_10225 [Rhodospirillales bacterium]
MRSRQPRGADAKPRRRSLHLAVAGLLAVGTGGCSSVPDAVNPVEWYRGAERAIFGSDEEVADATDAETAGVYVPPEAVPGADQSFPNLADVPDRPEARAPQDTAALRRGLIADREHARHSDLALAPGRGRGVPAPDDGTAAEGAPGAGGVFLPAVEPQRITLGAPAPRQDVAAQEAQRQAAARQEAEAREAARQRAAARRAQAAPAFSDVPPPTFSGAPPPRARQPQESPPPRPQFADVPPPTMTTAPPPPAPARTGAPPPPPALNDAAPRNGAAAAPADTAPPDAMAQRRPLPTPETEARSPAGTAERVAVIRFSGDSAALDDAETIVLERIAALHAEHGGTIRVVGHASHGAAVDAEQRAAMDQTLSRQRALAVGESLIRLGVPEESLRLRGSGAGGAADAAGQRVEIFFVY